MTENKPVKVKHGPGSFFVGATYPIRAIAAFMKYPKLRGYVLLPILLNLVVGVTIYALILTWGLGAIDALISSLPGLTASVTQWQPTLPALPLPTLPLPTLALPTLALPTVTLPHWSVHLPDWIPHWSIAFPSWHLPNWQLPSWQLPSWQINLPQINLPFPNWQINLPDWNLRLPDWQIPAWLVDAPLEIVAWILRLFLTIILLLVTGFIFLQFGVLLGAPWYGKLSEELEKIKTGQVEVIEVGLARDIGRAILYELKKLVLTLGIGIPLLLFNFLPGLGTAIATIGTITLGSTIVCLDFFDATLERRRLRFRQKLGMIRRSLPASAGFAIVCFSMVSIPLINLLGIPVCVAAGTLFVCDRILPELKQLKSDSNQE